MLELLDPEAAAATRVDSHDASPSPAPRRPTRRPRTPAPSALRLAFGAIVLLAVLLLCAALGSVAVPLGTTLSVIGHHLGLTATAPSGIDDQIVWELRLPRVIGGALVGAALALAGAMLQVTVRNPLADPQVLGASAGASAGAVGVLTVLGVSGFAWVSLGAFAGATLALALVLVLGMGGGRVLASQLVLAGIAVASLFTALTSFLQFGADPQRLQAIVFWLLGSLAGVRWSALVWLAPVVVIATIAVLRRAGAMDALAQGDVAASSLGVNPGRERLVLVGCSALLTGAAIAVAGGVGFVGLVIPHVVRLVRGGAHDRTLLATAMLGAAYLPLMDLLSRTIRSPEELPLGILTALVGCPFFIVLLRRRGVRAVA